MPLLSSAAILLDEISRTGSIRRAAERLNSSPSAVNRQILNLEAEYGLALFERLPRGVRLTAAGETLVSEVRRWRRDEEAAMRHIQEMQGLRRGHVTLGVVECVASNVMPDVIERVSRSHPGLTLDIKVGGTDAIVSQLLAKEIEIAVAFNMPVRADLRFIKSIHMPASIVVGCHHPLVGRKSVTLADCVGYTLVLPSGSLAFRAMIDNALANAGIRPVASVTTDSIQLMKAAVRHTNYISFLGHLDAAPEVATGALCLLPLISQIPGEDLSVCTRSRQIASRSTNIMTESISDVLAVMLAAEKSWSPVKPVAMPQSA